MKKYFFIVRPWNVEFFLHLRDLLIAEGEVEITFFTMQYEAFAELKSNDIEVLYFPRLAGNYTGEGTLNLKGQISNHFGYSVNRLYDTERFKADANSHEAFIDVHLECLEDIIPEQCTLISLTLDHFVYILAAHINLIKGGENFCIQPMGFPKNANVVLSTPWTLTKVRNTQLGNSFIQDYKDSLSLRPENSIHYMKKEKNQKPTIAQKLSILWDQYKIWKIKDESRNPYSYLEKRTKHPLKALIRKNQKQKRWTQATISVDEIKNRLDKKEVGKVFYFPLQMEPEMSTLAYSPFLRDQIEIIRLLAMSIDPDDVILLKENPKMIHTRENSFYKEIERYPNVEWVGLDENSRDVTRLSFKVITVTGTASIEAACLGIKSMVFGYPPFVNLLYQKPVCESALTDFRTLLYSEYSKDAIEKKLQEGWKEYSKSVFFYDLIPKWNGSKVNLQNSQALANKVNTEVLKKSEVSVV